MKNITTFCLLLIIINLINTTNLMAEVKIENINPVQNLPNNGSNNVQLNQDNSNNLNLGDTKLITNSEIQIDKYPISEKSLHYNYGFSLAFTKDLKTFKTNSSIINKIISEIFYIKNLTNNEYNNVNQILGSRLAFQSNLLETINYSLKNFEIGFGGNILFLEYDQKSFNKRIAMLPNISLIYNISDRLKAKLNFISSAGIFGVKSTTNNKIIINNLDCGLSINF